MQGFTLFFLLILANGVWGLVNGGVWLARRGIGGLGFRVRGLDYLGIYFDTEIREIDEITEMSVCFCFLIFIKGKVRNVRSVFFVNCQS